MKNVDVFELFIKQRTYKKKNELNLKINGSDFYVVKT
jgi:hypothetical protein